MPIARGHVVHRLTPDDVTELATETATGPMQIGAVLHLDPPLPVGAVCDLLARRVPAVPRLRQRLVRPPYGLGRPIWVDDPTFDLHHHLRTEQAGSDGAAGMEIAALTIAAAAVVARLSRARPLWSATLVSDGADRCAAVVLVVHHVVADGLGTVAMLAGLLDGAAIPPDPAFPSPPPSSAELARDVAGTRLGALLTWPRRVARLPRALAELGVGRRTNRRPPWRSTSLNRPIGPRRRLAVVRAPLEPVIEAAHRAGGTVNDLLLAAVAGALGTTLHARGESLEHVVISVPVAARAAAAAGELGNQVGVIPLAVPVGGTRRDRVSALAALTHAATRPSAARGSSSAVLGLAFRLLGRLGIFGWFIDRQRLVNTFVTNVRGPAETLRLSGSRISAVSALGPIAGNVTVAFTALSYAGTMAVTIVADADAWPDLDVLAAALRSELDGSGHPAELVVQPAPPRADRSVHRSSPPGHPH